jgi:NADH-ubiquinone oxidoreductase chain 5
MSLSVGIVELAYFHLLTHALFKSLLFLCAGVFIHGSFNTQDVRLLGVMGVSGPVTRFYFVGCSLSLCGFPFLSGFYSRDLVLEGFIGSLGGAVILGLIILGTIFTISYSIRLFLLRLFRRGGSSFVKSGVESRVMLGPMRVLFLLAMTFGAVLSWCLIPVVFIFIPRVVKLLMLFVFIGLIVRSGLVRVKATLEGLNYGGLNLLGRHWLKVMGFLGSIWWLGGVSVS